MKTLGVIFLGIGIFLGVIAAGLKYYVAPHALNIPYTLKPSTTIAEAANGQEINTDTNDPTNVAALLSGSGYLLDVPLRSYTLVVPQPGDTVSKLTGSAKDTAVAWEVYDETDEIAGNKPLTASKVELALDRSSGAVLANSDGSLGLPAYPDNGQAYKLPFNSEQTTYPYWDGTLGKTLDMAFVDEETFEGLTVYKYAQAKAEGKIDGVAAGLLTADQLDLLKSVIGGGSGDVYYSVERTLWVEPVTGQYLDVHQSIAFEFRGGNGANRTLLAGDFAYTDDTKAKTLDDVKTNRSLLLLVQNTGPLYGGGAGAVLVILAIIFLAIPSKKKTPAAPAATPTPVASA